MILPVTARDEEWSPTTQESMFNFVRLSDGGIERLDNVRPETVILCDLATRLLPDSPIPFAKFKEHPRGPQGHRRRRARPGAARRHRRGASKEFHIKNRVLHDAEIRHRRRPRAFRRDADPGARPAEADACHRALRGPVQHHHLRRARHLSQQGAARRRLPQPRRHGAAGVREGDRVTLASEQRPDDRRRHRLRPAARLGARLLSRGQCALRHRGRSAQQDPGLQVRSRLDRAHDLHRLPARDLRLPRGHQRAQREGVVRRQPRRSTRPAMSRRPALSSRASAPSSGRSRPRSSSSPRSTAR